MKGKKDKKVMATVPMKKAMAKKAALETQVRRQACVRRLPV